MKKIILFICIFLFIISPVFAKDTTNIEVTSRNIDIYEPIPNDLVNIYVKKIPDEKIEQYQKDMNIALKHILHSKITYDNKTLKQQLIFFDKVSSKVYKTYLKNKQNKEQNKKFIEKLEEMRGTISLYPNTIIEEMDFVINKYDLNIVQGSEADILLYKYYVKEYKISYTKEFKELLEFKEEIYSKINTYISEISNVV